ncbi:hypothetical protein Tco_0630217 [Tanacetum coccineum]
MANIRPPPQPHLNHLRLHQNPPRRHLPRSFHHQHAAPPLRHRHPHCRHHLVTTATTFNSISTTPPSSPTITPPPRLPSMTATTPHPTSIVAPPSPPSSPCRPLRHHPAAIPTIGALGFSAHHKGAFGFSQVKGVFGYVENSPHKGVFVSACYHPKGVFISMVNCPKRGIWLAV